MTLDSLPSRDGAMSFTLELLRMESAAGHDAAWRRGGGVCGGGDANAPAAKRSIDSSGKVPCHAADATHCAKGLSHHSYCK